MLQAHATVDKSNQILQKQQTTSVRMRDESVEPVLANQILHNHPFSAHSVPSTVVRLSDGP